MLGTWYDVFDIIYLNWYVYSFLQTFQKCKDNSTKYIDQEVNYKAKKI